MPHGLPGGVLLLHQHLPVFRGLGQEVISELCMLVTSVHLGRGNIVYMEGKFGNEMYPLHSIALETPVHPLRRIYWCLCVFFIETARTQVLRDIW